MSLLGAYKKKSNYDGYECLQLVDSGGDSFSVGRGSSSGSGTLAGSIAATIGQKAGPLREDNYSTMDSSGRTPHTPPPYGTISRHIVMPFCEIICIAWAILHHKVDLYLDSKYTPLNLRI